jgi:hypothetical protein
MRILRIVPDLVLDQRIGTRQYLIDDSRLGLECTDKAIQDLKLGASVIKDASGNRWISMRYLDEATQQSGGNLDAVQKLLAATHFPYYTKRFCNLPCAV